MVNKFYYLLIFVLLNLFFTSNQFVLGQKNSETQSSNQSEITLNILKKDSIRINKALPILPINIGSIKEKATNVQIDLIKIVSAENNIIPIKYNIVPQNATIMPDKVGKIFKINFDSEEISHTEPGVYSAYILISSANSKNEIEICHFEILDTKGALSTFSLVLQNIRDFFIEVVWNIFEIFFFLLIIGVIIWFVKLAIKGRHSLNVLSIVNETGSSGEMDGVASGIDDILITNLQDIAQKSRIAQIKHYWLSPSDSTSERKQELTAQAQSLNVLGGGIPLDLQKIGDISVGPVKIPLGEITAFITKIFGGNYVSGALQKYGPINKIVLRLEKKPSILRFKLDICYFEVTWPSHLVKTKNISEGVPTVIEELAYRITLNIAEKVGTPDWQAYKYFLEGILSFRDYEENRTRKDRLRDAIKYWRESVRIDPGFAKAHYNLGVALDMETKYEEALFRYQKVIEMSPELVGAEAHYNIAKLYWDIYKDDNQTIEELKKGQLIDPELAENYNLMGLVYSNKYQDKKALEMYEEAIKRIKGEPNPTYYYNQCVAKYHLKDYKGAKQSGEKVLNIYGKEHKQKSILQTMGMIHIQLNEHAKALNYFEEGLMIEPGNKDLLDGYGVALTACNQLDKALIIQRRLVRLWPEFGAGYNELSKTLRKMDYPTEEIETYELIAGILSNPDIWSDSNKKDIQKFRTEFEDKVKLHSASVLQKKIFAAVFGGIAEYFYANDLEAVQAFEQMFQSEVINIQYLLEAESLHNYGYALFKLGNSTAKENNMTLAEQSFNKSIDVLNKAAILYTKNQIYDIAQCRSDLAEAFVKIKKYQSADEAFKISIELYKKIDLFKVASGLHVKDANCLIDGYWAGKGNLKLYDLARQECNLAIQFDSSNHTAFHVNGNTYYDLKQYAKAIPEYEKAVEINYDLPGAHYNLGLCYFYLGQYEAATKKFETTIKLDEFYADPENFNKPDPYQRLAACFENLGQLDKSVEILRRISDMYPRSTKYNLLLGQYLVKTNQLDEAANQFIECLDFDKDNKQNLKHLALNYLADLYADMGADIDMAYFMCRSALVKFKPQTVIYKPDSQKINFQLLKSKDLSSIRNTLGWIFYQKGQVSKAIAFLEKSLMHALGEAKAHSRLAYAYEKYAQSCPDKIVSDVLEKARNQWNLVLNLDSDENLNKIASEHLQAQATK